MAEFMLELSLMFREIDQSLKQARTSVRATIDTIANLPIKTYTFHSADTEASMSAMDHIESLEGNEREDAQRAYTEIWRTKHTYRVRHLVLDTIEIAAGLVRSVRRPSKFDPEP